jgi:hypothetical protein
MPKKSEYQERKAAGQCVRAGCKRTPRKNSSRRSYCDFHNDQNRKNSDAWKARQGKAPVKKAKTPKVKKAPVTRKPKLCAAALGHHRTSICDTSH